MPPYQASLRGIYHPVHPPCTPPVYTTLYTHPVHPGYTRHPTGMVTVTSSGVRAAAGALGSVLKLVLGGGSFPD